MKNELTVEQSAQLIELGVNPKLASGSQYVDTGEKRGGIELPPVLKPVFALADVIAILPKEIDGFGLEMVSEEDRWYVGYYFNGLSKSSAPELIDALYQLLCWVITNGYYKPKTEEKCTD